MTNRTTHGPEFKARVAMEANSGRKAPQEIAADNAIHPVQVSQWKKLLLEESCCWKALPIFSVRAERIRRKEISKRERLNSFKRSEYSKMELRWLKKKLNCSTAHELRRPGDQDHAQLSVRRQCELLELPKFTRTTGRDQSGPRSSASWPESIPATRKILLQKAAAWSTTWPQKGSRRGGTSSKTLSDAGGYELFTRNQRRPFQASQRNHSQGLWTCRKS